MNKNERLFVALLVAALAGYLIWNFMKPKAAPAPAAPAPAAQTVAAPAATPAPAPVAAPVATPAPAPAPAVEMSAPAPTAVLTNDLVRLTFTSAGAAMTEAEMLEYPALNDGSDARVTLETGSAFELLLAGEKPGMPYTMNQVSATEVKFTRTVSPTLTLERIFRLQPDYVVAITDIYKASAPTTLQGSLLSAGWLTLGDEKSDTLSADTLKAGDSKPIYREGKLGKVLGAKSAFMGCGTSSNATGLPVSATEVVEGPSSWVALKTRFFTTLLMPEQPATTTLAVVRDPAASTLKVTRVGASMTVPQVVLQPGTDLVRETKAYVGPKKQSSLRAFGSNADGVMDFGFFAWFCRPLLWLLNLLYAMIPNYGVAIILLTLIVRIVFWPLTHKSTISMRKMSVIQPQIKALQQQFKDQPQKIQQETFKLYREHKVNPFSSCLPMLIQIPIFIALFTVLRSAVELRFASFLWIADLSQPENLLAGVLPMPLNILPILTALTMALQTHLSPSTGDATQKKMMTWMMPIMLLFMFYSMASALCLYWTVSQLLSILQMWYIRKTAK